jgi:ketopantoate reductase
MLEIEPIWGVPLRRAAAAGVSVPALQSLYASLLGLQTTS